MATTRVVIHKGKPFKDLFDQWVKSDGKARGQRVLAAAKANAPVDSGDYKRSLEMDVVQHPSRPVVRVGAHVPYGMAVEAAHGTLARAKGAAR